MENRKVSRAELQQVARSQIVTTGELSRILRTSRTNAARLAFGLKRRGLLVEVRRGLYASVPLDVDPSRFRPDPYLAVHGALGKDYAFSHFSALSLLGGEHALRNTVHVSRPNARPRSTSVGRIRVQVHSLPPAAWKNSILPVRRGRQTLLVTTPERTLVDLTELPRRQQDYESELQAAMDLVPRVEPAKLLKEVLSRRHKSTRGRVGHLLRMVAGDSDEMAPVLRSIELSLSSASNSYFGTRPKSPSNRLDTRFKVVYPEQV